MYRSAAQAVHRNREPSAHARDRFRVANFTEVDFDSVDYRLSGRTCQFLFPAMSLSGSQSFQLLASLKIPDSLVQPADFSGIFSDPFGVWVFFSVREFNGP